MAFEIMQQSSIFCDNCGDPCKAHFIAGQCPTCGGFICKACLPHHLCMPRPKDEVKRMKPEYVDYGMELLTPPYNP